LHENGVPAELHVFREGGHGFGIREARGPAAGWTSLCARWLRAWEGSQDRRSADVLRK
jgi:hypothetical protein